MKVVKEHIIQNMLMVCISINYHNVVKDLLWWSENVMRIVGLRKHRGLGVSCRVMNLGGLS